jgi:hypothetical protein
VVNLGYDITATLPGLRVQAESMMVDECTITGEPTRVWDEATATWVETPTVTYTGKCQVKSENVQAAQVDAQGQLLVVQSLVLKLPVDASVNVAPGDVAVLTVCTFDAQLVGKKLRVGAFHHQSYATARRLPVREMS